MRLKVPRGILIASTSPTALTVADAPLSPRSPLSPTTVRPREASISARSLLLPPGNPFLTSTVPERSTNKLSCSTPSSTMFSPGSKETGSDASANSSRSSSVRNSKNLIPRSVSSIIPSPLQPRSLWRDYTPAFRPGAPCERLIERSPSLRGIPKGVTISPKKTGAAFQPRPLSCLAVRRRPLVEDLLVVEDLDINVVDAGVGQPDLLGSSRGEVQVPATNVRPTVSDLDDHGIASVGHQQVRTERQVR